MRLLFLVCSVLALLRLGSGCDVAPADDDDVTDAAQDDDDTTAPDYPGCPWALVEITRDPSLPPIVDAMKLWLGAYRPGDVSPGQVPHVQSLASDNARSLGPLQDPGDSYAVPFCVPTGDLAVAVMLDTNWDDDACSAGDYLGVGLGVFSAQGDVIEVVLDHLLSEQDCHHGG